MAFKGRAKLEGKHFDLPFNLSSNPNLWIWAQKPSGHSNLEEILEETQNLLGGIAVSQWSRKGFRIPQELLEHISRQRDVGAFCPACYYWNPKTWKKLDRWIQFYIFKWAGLLYNPSMYSLATITMEPTHLICVFLFLVVSQYPSLCFLSSPPLSSPSFTEVRYCISGRPFLTVSNAHQIPQVGGLRGLISSNAFTYTKGLREEITFEVALALHCTSGPPLDFSCSWKFCGS